MHRWSLLAVVLAALSPPTLAHADELEAEPASPPPTSAPLAEHAPTVEHAADPAHDHVASLGFRIVAGTSRAYRSNTWVFGFGATSELHLGLGFELGIGAAVLLGEVSEVFPFELFLRKAFQLAPDVDFYVQAGPILALLHQDGHDVQSLLGGTFAGGFTLWMNEGFGILVEATYQFIAEEDVVHDIEGAVGIAIRL
jgi:hypothetical protein